jgi:hypothetical protein
MTELWIPKMTFNGKWWHSLLRAKKPDYKGSGGGGRAIQLPGHVQAQIFSWCEMSPRIVYGCQRNFYTLGRHEWHHCVHSDTMTKTQAILHWQNTAWQWERRFWLLVLLSAWTVPDSVTRCKTLWALLQEGTLHILTVKVTVKIKRVNPNKALSSVPRSEEALREGSYAQQPPGTGHKPQISPPG